MTTQINVASKTARAPRWVTFFGPITKFLLAKRVPLGYNGLLTVPGRNSGLPRTTPLAIIDVAGTRWVWSPWGDVNWVQNLRAAGRATVTVRGRREEVRAIELDPSQRVGFFRDVLRPVAHKMRFGPSFIRVVDGVDVDRPIEEAEGRCVFELVRSDG